MPVAHGVHLLRAVSAAPGLLDVYELLEGESEAPPAGIERHGEQILVFGYTGSESAGDTPPELLHAPGGLGSA